MQEKSMGLMGVFGAVVGSLIVAAGQPLTVNHVSAKEPSLTKEDLRVREFKRLYKQGDESCFTIKAIDEAVALEGATVEARAKRIIGYIETSKEALFNRAFGFDDFELDRTKRSKAEEAYDALSCLRREILDEYADHSKDFLAVEKRVFEEFDTKFRALKDGDPRKDEMFKDMYNLIGYRWLDLSLALLVVYDDREIQPVRIGEKEFATLEEARSAYTSLYLETLNYLVQLGSYNETAAKLVVGDLSNDLSSWLFKGEESRLHQGVVNGILKISDKYPQSLTRELKAELNNSCAQKNVTCDQAAVLRP